jgi:hypothetical protein
MTNTATNKVHGVSAGNSYKINGRTYRAHKVKTDCAILGYAMIVTLECVTGGFATLFVEKDGSASILRNCGHDTYEVKRFVGPVRSDNERAF